MTGTGNHAPVAVGGHMCQLDSLRTIAVLAVISSHYARDYFIFFNWGYAGVLLFFVLSGFLITGILLRARERDEHEGTLKLTSLKRFYIRRTLRIFPLYYAIVIVCLFFVPVVREAVWWYLSYTVNWKMAFDGRWIGMTGSFWSLAVEEQFYLIWPLLILFSPARLIPYLLVAIIAMGPLSRLIFIAAGFSEEAVHFLPTSCMDSLGLGALLAYSWRPIGRNCLGRLPLGSGALVGVLSLAIMLASPRDLPWVSPLIEVLSPLSLSLTFVWMVSTCARGVTGTAGKMLEWRPSLYLGKISYGLYAFHLFIHAMTNKLFGLAHLHTRGLMHLTVSMLGTIIIATVSWFLFEKPLNDLKGPLADFLCGGRRREVIAGSTGLQPDVSE
jgi:peptidoglycan/LPS O-acetylase OafA/YrhL